MREPGPEGGTGAGPVPSTLREAIGDEEAVRADAYVLLARLLATPPSDELLEVLRTLQAGEGKLGGVIATLAAAAREATLEQADDEYHALFIGLDRGEVVPYASHYLTGLVYDKPLLALRRDMVRLGISRDESTSEPEDHIAILCEIMAGLILGTFGEEPAPLGEQQRFFNAHLNVWAPRFFQDLERAQSASLYRSVGRLGGLFMEIERQAFEFVA